MPKSSSKYEDLSITVRIDIEKYDDTRQEGHSRSCGYTAETDPQRTLIAFPNMVDSES